MKNITLSADDHLIRSAREKASKQKTTLNALFRKWLAHYMEKDKPKLAYDKLMEQFSHVRSGKKFSREELNER
jgi:hypothetical protein